MIPADRGSVPEPADDLADVIDGLTECERAALHVPLGNAFEFKAYGRAAVREAVNALFSLKCAYCESSYAATQPVDVEHYRPKGRVVVTKAPRKVVGGYWWLASNWTNLLPSCVDCNRARRQASGENEEIIVSGKADYFPLLDEGVRAIEPGGEADEAPVLINPCDCNPADYLRYEIKEGESLILPKNVDFVSTAHRRARGSIDILGLNRTGLVKDRSERVKRAEAWLKVARREARRANDLPKGEERVEAETALAEAITELREYARPTAPWSAAVRAAVVPQLSAMGLVV